MPMKLHEWPVRRVVWLSVAWVVASLGLLIGLTVQVAQGSEGVGAVGFGIAEVLVFVIGPPFLFILAWSLLRRRSAG